ncbi:hypothetical protein BEP19_08575 [Ammoniphilus oxalaticus]|uniref:Pyruvate phosphate dikinase AMP/ATP-binding domain-containing protein n=1 Tax=Ammoniphilus oxalaticus TaxID=66863 RepID=A0A419SK90_9BACL|nr:PEP/pyruvate-binding domain-containing protein [Ammoniphilus oxalaticus]RKD24433.1 hypothetical protein BEP19_08575 [Ammoniphilus oxalaticus]
MTIISLLAAAEARLELVGGKAKNLGAMLAKKFPTPDGFIITARAFQQFLDQDSFRGVDLLTISEDEFIERPLPSALRKELKENYQRLMGHKIYAVAVRSSSAFEDSESASFSGQFETFLSIRNFESLQLHVKRCWYSAFSPLVQQYAAMRNISLEEARLGVIVQGMVDADVSGVAFSKNPITNDQNQIIINAAYGLGEGIVSGEITPDQFLYDRQTRTWMDELGLKEVKVIADHESGVEIVPTTAEEQNSFCLQPAQLEALLELTFKLEREMKSPVDVEFAFAGSQLYALQARPITT